MIVNTLKSNFMCSCIKVAVVGDVGSGKTSLINAIINKSNFTFNNIKFYDVVESDINITNLNQINICIILINANSNIEIDIIKWLETLKDILSKKIIIITHDYNIYKNKLSKSIASVIKRIYNIETLFIDLNSELCILNNSLNLIYNIFL